MVILGTYCLLKNRLKGFEKKCLSSWYEQLPKKERNEIVHTGDRGGIVTSGMNSIRDPFRLGPVPGRLPSWGSWPSCALGWSPLVPLGS